MDRWMDGRGGHLRHGDLHRLQHLLYCLHRALVLLGAATSQLHDGKEGAKTKGSELSISETPNFK